MKYARIVKGEVAELFQTDGDITQMFHPEMIWAEVTSAVPPPLVGFTAIETDTGWVFSRPAPPIPSQDELKQSALALRDAYLSAANEKTAGMADAYIAGLLDETDTATFKAFAAYKLSLNKIDKQPGYPDAVVWPEAPV